MLSTVRGRCFSGGFPSSVPERLNCGGAAEELHEALNILDVLDAGPHVSHDLPLVGF
jgi:hypothetical protein